jgi:tRNA U34 5-methylaminomethyl-2-thiouridine-forming methyltransferase MnmC
MPELIITEDGSHSLFVHELNEHYHSVRGAYTESQHVFIEAGLNQIKRRNIRILEMGFGTGLNALLTLAATNHSQITIHYTGIDKYPLPKSITSSLNYELIAGLNDRGMLHLMHDVPWNQEALIRPGFVLEKMKCDMKDLDQINVFDLVYFDAFAPEKQPELWTEDLFRRLFISMRSDSILTTYSSKGMVRRNLQSAGFRVEKIPGPPGKREMTRAYKA